MNEYPSGFGLAVTPYNVPSHLEHQAHLATLSDGAMEAVVVNDEIALRPTRWLGDEQLLATLGLTSYTIATPKQLAHLAKCQHPTSGEPLVPESQELAYIEFVVTAPIQISSAYSEGTDQSKVIVISHLESAADRLIRNHLISLSKHRNVAYALATDVHYGVSPSPYPGLHLHARVFNAARDLEESD